MTDFYKTLPGSTALRDMVLPKLISSEIRINDAEKFLRERDL